MSFSTYAANAMLDYTFRGVSFNRPTAWWVQLHYGDPGTAGTANVWGPPPARVRCTDWEASSYGWLRNTVDLLWTGLPNPGTNDDIGWATIWDAESGGNCLQICYLQREDFGVPLVFSGDCFRIPIGYLVIHWVTP